MTQTPPGGWGVITGLAVHHAPATYGQGTTGANAYAWVFPPDPNGLPTVGNNAFTVKLEAAPSVGIGALLMGRRQDPPQPYLCVQQLVALPPFFSLALMPNPNPTGPLTIPLPIPNNPSLRGAELFLQSVHADPQACGLATSEGLWITVL